MANLKDIGYGVGKYLEASDASAIPDIGTNRKNVDLLNFKVATNNAYALYNFKDGMIDAYQDQTGVDATASTNDSYDSTDKVYKPFASSETTEIFTRPWTWLQFDGSDASTTFTESGVGNVNGAWGANGNAQLDTAQKKFGTASLLLDGSGDYLSGAWNRWWGGYGLTDGQRGHFANYNFTIDCWVRLTSVAGGTQCIFCLLYTSDAADE